jgi:flagellar basal body rod protein FlgG
VNYGLYLSASGALVHSHRVDVASNNLANVNTTGFKPVLAALQQRAPEASENNLPMHDHHALLDRLGGGVLGQDHRLNLSAGAMQQTGNPLDVALPEAGRYFAIGRTDADTGATDVMLTRDGRFSLDADGRLVTVSGGHPVLDDRDQPIRLDPELPAEITAAGEIAQDGDVVARLQVATAPDAAIRPAGGTLLSLDPGATRTPLAEVQVMPGHVEASGVNAMSALMQVINATKSATGNAKMIQYHDMMMDKSINTLGRI